MRQVEQGDEGGAVDGGFGEIDAQVIQARGEAAGAFGVGREKGTDRTGPGSGGKGIEAGPCVPQDRIVGHLASVAQPAGAEMEMGRPVASGSRALFRGAAGWNRSGVLLCCAMDAAGAPPLALALPGRVPADRRRRRASVPCLVAWIRVFGAPAKNHQALESEDRLARGLDDDGVAGVVGLAEKAATPSRVD